MLDDRHHQRCFPGPAGDDIADHNDGNVKVFNDKKTASVQRPAYAHQHAIDLRDWPEQTSQPAAYAPGF